MRQITEEAAHDREQLLVEFADARAMVDEALTALRRQNAERLVGPMIAQLRLRYRHTALEGVERLFERNLAGVGEPEREVIRQWAETLARRFAHVPSVGLRDLAFQVGPSAVEAFFDAAEPELVRELRNAIEHAAILARSLGIPAVSGLRGLLDLRVKRADGVAALSRRGLGKQRCGRQEEDRGQRASAVHAHPHEPSNISFRTYHFEHINARRSSAGGPIADTPIYGRRSVRIIRCCDFKNACLPNLRRQYNARFILLPLSSF